MNAQSDRNKKNYFVTIRAHKHESLRDFIECKLHVTTNFWMCKFFKAEQSWEDFYEREANNMASQLGESFQEGGFLWRWRQSRPQIISKVLIVQGVRGSLWRQPYWLGLISSSFSPHPGGLLLGAFGLFAPVRRSSIGFFALHLG